jgi:hypothetical protein
MTGTNPIVTPISNHFATHLPLGGERNGGHMRDSDVMIVSNPQMEMGCNPLETMGVEASVGDVIASDVRVGDGIRTRDIQIHNLVP